jgi:two-component system capsular synthesis sensor histidine kinase RcsC
MLHAAYARNTKEVTKQHLNIKNSIKLVSNRIRDLLDRRLIEHKSFQPRDVEFSPKCIVGDMVSFYNGQLAEYDVIIRKLVDERMPTLLIGDADRVQQVLQNLLSNALKFVPKKHGLLTLKTCTLTKDDKLFL